MEMQIRMMTDDYNLCIERYRQGYETKEETIKQFKQYAEAIRTVFITGKEFERHYEINLKRLKELE